MLINAFGGVTYRCQKNSGFPIDSVSKQKYKESVGLSVHWLAYAENTWYQAIKLETKQYTSSMSYYTPGGLSDDPTYADVMLILLTM